MLGGWIGIITFYRQKEFDLVRQRYLEGAIDIIAAQHEENMNAWHHNWSRCLHLLLDFKIQENLFELPELKQGFIEPKTTEFQVIAHFRLIDLIGSSIVWRIYEMAMLFTTNANAKVTKEIPDTIRVKLTSNQIKVSPTEIFDESFKIIKKLEKDSKKFTLLTEELEKLAVILGKQKMKSSLGEG